MFCTRRGKRGSLISYASRPSLHRFLPRVFLAHEGDISTHSGCIPRCESSVSREFPLIITTKQQDEGG